jgi:outer membrane protein assembly factor BamE (lipoprotein component of BamABCDE complex)
MNARLVAALLFTLLLAGCATPKPADTTKTLTSTVRRGRDFDSSKVKDILKGKTTTQEIVQWFGQPFAKKVVSADQVGWLYAWRQSTVTLQGTRHDVKGKQTGYKKRLELLISNDVVLNFSFEEGPFESDAKGDAK